MGSRAKSSTIPSARCSSCCGSVSSRQRVAFDITHLITGDDVFSTVAFWNIAAGIVGGLTAALFAAHRTL